MSVSCWLRAQHLAGEAEMAERAGDHERAADLYRQSADWGRAVLRGLPARPRTRGIVAVHAVSCLQRTGDWAEVERCAGEVLELGELPEWARARLREMQQEVRRRQELAGRANERAT